MKSNQAIAVEVLMGKWGNGKERNERLTAAGYDARAIQSIVNALVADGTFPGGSEPEITGTETLEIEFDISKYNSLCVNFKNGAVENG